MSELLRLVGTIGERARGSPQGRQRSRAPLVE